MPLTFFLVEREFLQSFISWLCWASLSLMRFFSCSTKCCFFSSCTAGGGE